jgi:acyl-lipid omega-6 desaturase (Delta-12 desaturase)
MGTAVFVLVLSAWAGLAAAALHTSPGALQVLLGTLLGLLAALGVVLGHDAEHGSLSPWPAWNALAARLAFLPAWQPASGWTHEHQRHHAFTNLKPRDEGYPPPSPEDWRAMGWRQRLWWRCALSLPGVGLLYLDVWWRCVIWVRRPPPARRSALRADSGLVMAFAAVQTAATWSLAGGPWAVASLVLLPFGVMNTLVSAITLLHHRHPRVRWYDDVEAWRLGRGQPRAVHLALPKGWQWALLNIFEHGAHHADLRRPFAALPAAQRTLNLRDGEAAVVVHDAQPWRLRPLRRVMRNCQLYDYRQHRWLRFDQAVA